MFKISKKVALLLSFGTIFAPTSADGFLSKLVKDYPYAIPYCCVAMGLFSFAQGMRALNFKRIDEMRERLRKEELEDFIHNKNIEEVKKIGLNQSNFFFELFDIKEKNKPAVVRPIKFDVEHYVENLTPKDYIIHSTQKLKYSEFPDEDILVHKVTHCQLPPLMEKNNEKEWERSHSSLFQATADRKIKKSWLPEFCFGVSVLNFTSAFVFAGYQKKA